MAPQVELPNLMAYHELKFWFIISGIRRLPVMISHKWHTTDWSRQVVCKFCGYKGMQESLQCDGMISCNTCSAAYYHSHA